MPITPDQRERLDQLMNSRRLELGITWRDVATRAGVSYEALRSLRAGTTGIRELTATKISRALDWEPRSVGAILAGGEPAEAAADEPAVPADAPVCTFEQSILGEAGLSEETKAQVIRIHRQGGHAHCRPLGRSERERKRALA